MVKRSTKLPSDNPKEGAARNPKTLSQFLIDYDRERELSDEDKAKYVRLSQFFDRDQAVRRKAAREAIESLVLRRSAGLSLPAEWLIAV